MTGMMLVVLSEAKDLHVQVLRFAQDDSSHSRFSVLLAPIPGTPYHRSPRAEALHVA